LIQLASAFLEVDGQPTGNSSYPNPAKLTSFSASADYMNYKDGVMRQANGVGFKRIF